MQSATSKLHVIRRGLSLPVGQDLATTVFDAPQIQEVALMPDDWVDVAARPLVEPGQRVRIGEPLFEDRRNPGLKFVSPGAGIVSAIHRGDRRSVLSIVVSLDQTEESVTFESWSSRGDVSQWSAAQLRDLMIESGMWTALRERPFGTIPPVDRPACPIFVTAIDTRPYAPDPAMVIGHRLDDFRRGLEALVRLADGMPVYACIGAGPGMAGLTDVPGVETHRFSGPHPAGLPGTHIHTISPASVEHPRWYIGYPDVIALGHLITTGRLLLERMVSVGGPAVTDPVIWRTRVGAAIGPLLMGHVARGENRVISGSLVYGRGVFDIPLAFVGSFHNQLTVVAEDRERHFLGWLGPGIDTFSVLPIFLSKFLFRKRFRITTSTYGSPRAVMPFGVYERVMPFDMMATQLCRAIMAQDVEWAIEMGALELEEEDLALCTLVCPGKNDYGPALRRLLTTIRKEG